MLISRRQPGALQVSSCRVVRCQEGGRRGSSLSARCQVLTGKPPGNNWQYLAKLQPYFARYGQVYCSLAGDGAGAGRVGAGGGGGHDHPRLPLLLQKSRGGGAHCTLHTAHYTLHTTHCTLHTAHNTLHTTHYKINSAHYTLNTTKYTRH